MPIEIYILIIAQIEDKKTLFACLTVSRSLLQCVEQYLYASVDLSTGPPSRLLSFQSAIEPHPKRLDHVRSLTIRLDPDLLRSAIIDDILCKVNNIEYLHIRTLSKVLLPPFPRFFGSDRKTLPSLTQFRWEGYLPRDSGLSRFLELQTSLQFLDLGTMGMHSLECDLRGLDKLQELCLHPLIHPTDLGFADGEWDYVIRSAIRRLQELQATDSSNPSNDPETVPREYVNQLTPPVGTSFFSRQSVTLFDNEYFAATFATTPIGTIQFPVQTLTWKVDIYTYVTGATPDDSQFQENGGSVMIVIVHSGHLAFDGRYGDSMFRVIAPSAVSAQKQLPPTGSGIKNGDYWNYTIAYDQIMNMFNNGGNGTLNFGAKYKEDFSRKELQSGGTVSGGVEFGSEFRITDAELPGYDLATFEANSTWSALQDIKVRLSPFLASHALIWVCFPVQAPSK
ncbi:hypothetical protein EYR36_010104 [Pleurotus pulmonarius]|nr:hypothetical protein EYR36_010104 [Pleurotus pulmonarius]